MEKNKLTEEYIGNVTELAMELDHKDGVNPEDWKKVDPKLLIILDALVSYCDTMNLPIKITSIIRPKIEGVSKTDIHADGRAFDISLIGWTNSDARDCAHTINRTLNTGAYSLKDGLEREVVFEDGINAGQGRHLHLQCRR
jgi:hypothetical protein